MRQLGKTLLLLFVCITVGNSYADEIKEYRNEEYGYSVAYPADWDFEESSTQIDIATKENAYYSEENAAGITILVEDLLPEDENDPEKACQRIAGGFGSHFKYENASNRFIGGEKWYLVHFSFDADAVEGEICVLIKNNYVYFLGIFYKFQESRDEFGSTIDDIVASFQFLKVEYKRFLDDEKGVSFEYPSTSEIMVQRDNISIPYGDSLPDPSGRGAVIFLGVIDPEQYGNQDLNETEIFEYLIKDAEGVVEIITKPVKTKGAGTSWYKAEFIQEQMKLTIYLHNEFGLTFAIVLMFSPSSAAADFDPFFKTFLGSLSIDMEKWAAALKEEEEE